MGKHKYVKPEPSNIRGLCVKCGKNAQKQRGPDKFRALCSPCDKRTFSPESRKRTTARSKDKKFRPYRKHLKDRCIKCGFVPVHGCQLDVDHIDGNHKNNDICNLQTLCANCHRLKTYTERKAPC